MFILFSDLRGISLHTREGNEGAVDDLYFDDRDWALRYVVADVGGFFFGHRALVGIDVVGKPDMDRGEWPVELDKEALESAPRPEPEGPAGGQDRLYGAGDPYPPLILGPSGAAYTPFMAEYQLTQLRRERDAGERPEPHSESRLRSLEDLRGFSIRASDGAIGSAADFLVNPFDWHIRYMVVDTGDWLPGRRVVVPTEAIDSSRWDEREIAVSLTRHQIETSPEPADISGLKEAEDQSLLRHFGL